MEGSPLVGKNLQKLPIYESVKEVENNGPQETDDQKINMDHHGVDKNLWFERIRKRSRRQSSESSLIHITGTGTVLEETLGCKKCYRVAEKTETGPDLEDLPPGVGQYEDFHTIDWQRDLARDRFRHNYIDRKMSESFWGLIKGYYDACSGWICVFLVGLLAGSIAAFIDIGEGWMKDLRIGVCLNAFWLNREQCCWSSNRTFYEGDLCDQWYQWVDYINKDLSSTASYALSYCIYVLWSLFFGILASCMVRTMAPYACGSGIPEIKTILSGFIMRGYLGKMTLLVKSVTIMLAVSAGLSLGKEGPLVHVVCCIGNVFSYLFPKYGKNEAKKREILSAASAAGVSVAFNAPIGGVLFSLEEVSYYFPLKTLWRSFFCALVAAFVLRSINPFGTDHPIKYYMTDTRGWILIELLPFILLGILGGVIGAAFIRGNIAWLKFKKRTEIEKFPFTEVLIITFVTALIKYPNEFTRINASDLIKVLFSQCGFNENSLLCDYKRNMTSLSRHMEILETGPGIQKSLYLLSLALVSTWILTVFTYGVKVPAGLFVPSMAMGAIIGRMVGIAMQQLAISYRNSWVFRSACTPSEDCLSPSLYSMIGAAACLAGVTRMTVSLVVIMFELTGSVDYIVPLMATVVASKWVGDALYKEGIYDAQIHLWQYPFLSNKKVYKHSSMAIDLTSIRKNRSPLLCFSQEGMTLAEIDSMMEKTNHKGFPVIVSRETPYLVGYVLRRDVSLTLEYLKSTKEGISNLSPVYFTSKVTETTNQPTPLILSKIVDKAPITVTTETPMETVIDMFRKLGLRHILITDNGTLVDIITKKDVLCHIREMNVTYGAG